MTKYYIKRNLIENDYFISNSKYLNYDEIGIGVANTFEKAIILLHDRQPEKTFNDTTNLPDIIYYTYLHTNYDVKMHLQNECKIFLFGFNFKNIKITETSEFKKYGDYVKKGTHELTAILMAIRHATQYNYQNIEIHHMYDDAFDLLTNKIEPQSVDEQKYLQELNEFSKTHNIIFKKHNPYYITCKNDDLFNKQIIKLQRQGELKGPLECL